MTTSSTRIFARALAILGVLSAAPVLSAHASDLRMTVEQPRFTCQGAGSSLSRVAFLPGQAAEAAPNLPCCDGRLGCAQFLSTNTIVRPSHEWHG